MRPYRLCLLRMTRGDARPTCTSGGQLRRRRHRTSGVSAISKRAYLSMTNTQHNWDQFALLLIDVQRDFWPEQTATDFPDFPANIATLLTLCRNEAIEVIHLRASFKADMSDWMPKYMLLGRIPCVQGTAGLLTSICILFTTVSAMQKGFLAAVVEDCCADEPNAHRPLGGS